MRKPKLVSVKTYAKRCGVTTITIYDWIKKGIVVSDNYGYGIVIDLVKNGIKKRTQQGRISIDDHIANS